MQDTDKLLSFAQTVAREAGAVIREYFDASDKGVETKPNETPVTVADKLINQMVIDRVSATFPDHGILAEEGSQNEDRKQLWVCDPIDGTKGFIWRIPTAMFSLAYVVDGQPEVAVLYDAFQDRLFSAVRGQGANINGRPTTVSARDQLSKAVVGIVSGYRDMKARQAFFDDLLDRDVHQLFVPGNVFKGMLVAGGNIDAYVFPGRSAHDIAAVKLIVEEAGGKVTDLYGKEQRYDGPIYGAIVTNGHIHEQLVECMRTFGPENYVGY